MNCFCLCLSNFARKTDMIDYNVFQIKETIFYTLMSSLTFEASTHPPVKSGIRKPFLEFGRFISHERNIFYCSLYTTNGKSILRFWDILFLTLYTAIITTRTRTFCSICIDNGRNPPTCLLSQVIFHLSILI